MYRLLVLPFLLITFGCAGPISQPTVEQTSDGSSNPADVPADVADPQRNASLEYPEKTDVVRLLVRAYELESNGKFEEALVLTDQAVAIDPSSPKANKMKTKLEELLCHIHASPQRDARKRPAPLAQFTVCNLS